MGLAQISPVIEFAAVPCCNWKPGKIAVQEGTTSLAVKAARKVRSSGDVGAASSPVLKSGMRLHPDFCVRLFIKMQFLQRDI